MSLLFTLDGRKALVAGANTGIGQATAVALADAGATVVCAGLTKPLANERATKGINVNANAPGYIKTKNTEAQRAGPVRNAAILDRIPARRWGRTQDIAGAAVHLASPAAGYAHGAVLNVDGGWFAR